jgi:hypothetical protein
MLPSVNLVACDYIWLNMFFVEHETKIQSLNYFNVSSSSRVVKYLSHNPKVEGSIAGTGNGQKKLILTKDFTSIKHHFI